MKKRIRIQGMLIFFAVVAAIALSRVIVPRWKEESLDELLDVVGVVFVLSGFLFRITARGHKEEHSGGGTVLVRNGPYALVRHPMYFGTLLIGAGVVTLLFEPWAYVVFLIVYTAIYIPQINKEEAVLSKRFANDYAAYRRQTPLYIPAIDSLSHLRDHLSCKAVWIKKERSSLLWVIAGIVGGEAYEDVYLFGHHEMPQELFELFLVIAVTAAIIYLLFREKK